MKKLLCILAIICASPAFATDEPRFGLPRTGPKAADYKAGSKAADYTTVLNVPPGFVKHWIAPQPFTRVAPGTPDVIEILQGSGRELVFMVKPEGGETNILLLNDSDEQIANLLVVNPPTFMAPSQGPQGWQVFHKDNPDYMLAKDKK
jgi:hypothetical protein